VSSTTTSNSPHQLTTSSQDWADMRAKENQHTGMYRITGYGDFVVANRVSYEFGFKGPS